MNVFPAYIYLFQIDNRNNRKNCEICSANNENTTTTSLIFQIFEFEALFPTSYWIRVQIFVSKFLFKFNFKASLLTYLNSISKLCFRLLMGKQIRIFISKIRVLLILNKTSSAFAFFLSSYVACISSYIAFFWLIQLNICTKGQLFEILQYAYMQSYCLKDKHENVLRQRLNGAGRCIYSRGHRLMEEELWGQGALIFFLLLIEALI